MADGSWYSKLSHATVDWFRYHVVFCRAVAFISALLFSHSLVEKGVVSILVSYLEDHWKMENLPEVAAIMNVQEGLSAVMMIFIAHISDTWTGRFQMVLYSTVAYALGFGLLYLSAIISSTVFFYLAMVPLAAGIAGRDPALNAFLGDQMSQQEANPPKDVEVVQAQAQIQAQVQVKAQEEAQAKAEARAQFWSRLNKFLGAIVAFLVLGKLQWKENFLISAIAMAISGSIFCCGFRCYYIEKPAESLLTDVYLVFKAAIVKRHLDYPHTPKQFYSNDKEELELMPHVAVLRWLDKAAIEEQEKRGMLCPAAKVKKVKLLLTMAPLWTTFLIYCLVVATGGTFFILQSSNMNDEIGAFKAPLIFLFLMRSFSSFAASFLYELLIQTLWPATQRKRAWKVRIGLGMFCSFLSCIAARFVETHKLKLYEEKETKLLDVQCWYEPYDELTTRQVCEGKEVVRMSILWLTPQFCLLGLMEGLCEDGLVDFYYNQVADSMKRYGPPFNQWVLGMGKFLSILWILTFKEWFGKTIKESRLDNYYAILAILSLGNQCFYQYVSNMPIYNVAVAGQDVEELEETLTDAAENGDQPKSFIPLSHPSVPTLTQRSTTLLRWTETAIKDVEEPKEISTEGAENPEPKSSIPPSHPSIQTSTQRTTPSGWTKVRKLIPALKSSHKKKT